MSEKTTGRALMEAAPVNTFGHAFIRLRDPKWAEANAYLRLSVFRAASDAAPRLGPWAHLFSRQTQEAIGEPTPQVFMTIPGLGLFDPEAFMREAFEPWAGPLDPADC